MKNCNQTYSAISINMNGLITSMKTKIFFNLSHNSKLNYMLIQEISYPSSPQKVVRKNKRNVYKVYR